jgi:hypothetical protein
LLAHYGKQFDHIAYLYDCCSVYKPNTPHF